MTHSPETALREAAGALRGGDIGSARRLLEATLDSHPDSHPLLALAGVLACQSGDTERGAHHLRRAIVARPGDQASRVNLAMVLLDRGELAEAERVASDGDARDPRLARVRGYLDQLAGRNADAAASYACVVEAFPTDFESWNNLGNAQAAIGETAQAMRAFRRAIALRPGEPTLRINAAKALAAADRHVEQATLMREAAAAIPAVAEIWFELGLAEESNRDFAAGEAALRRALELDPGHVGAYLELGLLLENLNRIDELGGVIARAESNGVATPEINFLKAWHLRRQGKFAEALPLAEACPETIDPIRRAHLLGELADRLGDPDRAFAEFTEMNRFSEARTSEALLADGRRYLEEIAIETSLLETGAARGWAGAAPVDDRPAPIFIVGFPRSGTTLLDTLLMNMPQLHVLEEPPMLRQVEIALGDPARIADLSDDEVRGLRDVYFDELERVAPPPSGTTVVDKFPLHMARMGLIHRLFPDARTVLVERHPCDSVLSCFVSNFQPNRAMVNFFTLDGAADLYQAAFKAWAKATATLPIAWHPVRYEQMVEDLEGEMRPLLAFLGLPWTDAVLDNQTSAAGREHIRTASYAQVVEPIYKRSSGRWQRYRRHLEPILPVLAPWAARMGYSLEP